MKKIIFTTISAVLMMGSQLALAAAEPGQAAPNFQLTDANGTPRKLSDYNGKWLVLEWFNQDCPYVKKHYGSGNMQKLQKLYTGKNVAWLQVISSAKGKQGYLDASAALKLMKENGSGATATLLDPTGAMGKAYGAKTTPHMFVINPQGQVIYAGAIDNNDSADPKVIATSKNYISEALDAGMANRPIAVASSRPYGCSVKY